MKKRCRQSGKVKYRTHTSALTRGGRAMKRMTHLKGFHAYICEWCGHFHISSIK